MKAKYLARYYPINILKCAKGRRKQKTYSFLTSAIVDPADFYQSD